MDKKIEHLTMEDGREAERHTQTIEENGEVKHVTELFVEEPKVKNLTKRIVEIEKPMIVERSIETIGADGSVVEKTKEVVEGSGEMIDGISKEDLQKAIASVLMGMSTKEAVEAVEAKEAVEVKEGVSAMQSAVAERVEKTTSVNVLDIVLWIVIAGLGSTLAYVTLM